MFRRVIRKFTDPKKAKPEELVEEPNGDAQRRFEESVSDHTNAHGKRLNLSEGITKHIRSNGVHPQAMEG